MSIIIKLRAMIKTCYTIQFVQTVILNGLSPIGWLVIRDINMLVARDVK